MGDVRGYVEHHVPQRARQLTERDVDELLRYRWSSLESDPQAIDPELALGRASIAVLRVLAILSTSAVAGLNRVPGNGSYQGKETIRCRVTRPEQAIP
ncbi:hypothetical protein QFZ53_002843 [Microbacterium natoriense]|uniref:Uncharacterized protein n=1 Tax=Microbacterium natoriense TaxID=284570 RepID=A0AAW8F270_9MICO|nr:hypothetical protein [Microbacterium natoriense]MDQ0648647.1 hypothetical protein [Microbacterium natoriense]